MKISLSNVWLSTKRHLLMLISLNLGTDAWYCVTKGNSEFHLFVFCFFLRLTFFVCFVLFCFFVFFLLLTAFIV